MAVIHRLQILTEGVRRKGSHPKLSIHWVQILTESVRRKRRHPKLSIVNIDTRCQKKETD